MILPSLMDMYESVYMLPVVKGCSEVTNDSEWDKISPESCPKVMSTYEYQDEIYKTYQKLRGNYIGKQTKSE
jgi:hypothetical protein